MADLEGFHLANVLRVTSNTHKTLSAEASSQPEEVSELKVSRGKGKGKANHIAEDDNEDDDDGELVMRALNKVHDEWNRSILEFKTKIAALHKEQKDQVVFDVDFPPLEEEVEYGMEDIGFTYKTPIWPTFDDSDDTDTISESGSILDTLLRPSEQHFPSHATAATPPLLPPRLDQGEFGGHASSRSSIVYDRAWLIGQCSAHLDAFADPSASMTSKRLSIDIFTILRSEKPGTVQIGGSSKPFSMAFCRVRMTWTLIQFFYLIS